MLEFKPDLEMTMRRMEAFWEGEVLDRPVIQFHLEKPPAEQNSPPASRHPTSRARWLDAGYQAQHALARLSSRIFMGDSLPVACPNLGPEALAAFYGCPLEFGDYGTSWTRPILKSWDEADQLQLDLQHPYFLKLVELTDALLELGRGKFITGLPDFHPGGDLIASLRNPQDLAVDLLDNPERVKLLLDRLKPDYFRVYDFWYDKLSASGQPLTSWLELASYSKYYIPSNDFSGMISTKMYCEFFLQGIVEECRFLDRSIYHVDGIGALRHLDVILDIPELDAVQWVPGAGRAGFPGWVSVYQKIQSAGKAMIVYCDVGDLDLVMHTLAPRGLALAIRGVTSREMGEAVLSEMEAWTRA